MSRFSRDALLWLALLTVLAGVALGSRPLTPIDETRYVSVAWEMWLRGDFLVPYINGEPYSHKPPFLMWTIHAGWALFGVNEWWPRIISALFSFGSLLLVARLARRLWPDREATASLAPLMVLGSLLWALFSTATMFDILLAFWVLVGANGIWEARHGRATGWFWLVLSIGLGVLTKGPVVLLHLLPLALLAPWWAKGRVGERRWYGGVLLAVLGGSAIALAWAIPAALSGGEAYARAIFWGQTADRVADSFAHKRAWWWYLPTLPVILFPWFVWPPAWKALFRPAGDGESGVRFCIAWMVPVFVGFSLISGKQLHYLLPLFPPFALLVARGLAADEVRCGWKAQLLPSLALVALATVLVSIHRITDAGDLPEGALAISVWVPLLILLLALSLPLPWRVVAASERVVHLALSSIALLVVLHLGVVRVLSPAYDVRPAARLLNRLQQQGVEIAHVGKYHDQYHFPGRLESPLEVLGRHQVPEWVRRHPEGVIVQEPKKPRPLVNEEPLHQQPYRSRVIEIWRARQILEYPHLIRR